MADAGNPVRLSRLAPLGDSEVQHNLLIYMLSRLKWIA
ncbi:hypothetical protein CCP4SC76_6290002 [Gammaproteobacteria bacterium]